MIAYIYTLGIWTVDGCKWMDNFIYLYPNESVLMIPGTYNE